MKLSSLFCRIINRNAIPYIPSAKSEIILFPTNIEIYSENPPNIAPNKFDDNARLGTAADLNRSE